MPIKTPASSGPRKRRSLASTTNSQATPSHTPQLPSSSSSTTKSRSAKALSNDTEKRAKSTRNIANINPSEIARIRERNLLQHVERDNFVEDPVANMKKIPDFGLNEPKLKIVGRASKRALGSTDAKYRKNFEARRLDFINKDFINGYLYDLVTAPSATSSINLCETCWQISKFKCATCMAPLCHKSCGDVHRDLRCNKLVR